MKAFLDCQYIRLLCYTAAVTLSLAACSETPAPIAVKAINTEGLTLITIAPTNRAAQREWIGVVEATQQAMLSAQTSGRVAKLLVDVGDAVKENQVLARLSEVEQLAGQNRAKAMVSSALAAANEAEADFKRMTGLQREHVVSAQQLEQSLAHRDSARAQLASAQAQLREASQQISYTVIRAPFAGVISARHVQEGEAITPGSPLLNMNAPGQLRLRLSLPQADALALDAAQTAQIMLNDGTQLAATSMVVFPNSDAQTHTVTVRLDLPSATGLQPGMTLRALLASRAQVETATSLTVVAQPEIQIPISAVVQRSEVSGVYIVSKKTIALRQVRLGRRAGAQVEVLSGLNPGETIAADPLAANLRLAERL
jgi:RND family efflux transporter MFP subunit